MEIIIFVLLLIMVNFVIFCVMYSIGVFVVVYVIDYVFGKVLFKGFKCIDVFMNFNWSVINSFVIERYCIVEFVISDL